MATENAGRPRPGAATPVVAEFESRDRVERVVEELTRSGFATDQFSIVARGAGEHEGRFRPGAIMLTIRPGAREGDALRILRAARPRALSHGLLSVTGEVLEQSEVEEPAAG